MKSSIFLILVFVAGIFSSCSKEFECRCALMDVPSGLDNGSRVIQMDINGLNARKKAEDNCLRNEQELNTSTQTAVCDLQ